MMYEGCLKFLKQAHDALENKDIPKFARALSKSQAIIAELMNTLDFEKGGDIARDLDRLYDFMLFYLTEANLHKDVKKIKRVIGMVETISAAYHEIIDSGRAEKELKMMGESMDAAGSRRPETRAESKSPEKNNAESTESPRLPSFRSAIWVNLETPLV